MADKKRAENWQNETMRLGGEALVEKIFELADGQKDILGILDKMDDRFKDVEVAMQHIYKGFPGGDTEAHRRYHDLIIAQIEEYRQLKVAIKEKTFSGLIWAALVIAAGAGWLYLKTALGITVK